MPRWHWIALLGDAAHRLGGFFPYHLALLH